MKTFVWIGFILAAILFLAGLFLVVRVLQFIAGALFVVVVLVLIISRLQGRT